MEGYEFLKGIGSILLFLFGIAVLMGGFKVYHRFLEWLGED